MRLVARLIALSLGLPGCVSRPPVANAPPLPPGHVEGEALVATNRDAARVLASLRVRGIALTRSDVSRVDLLAGSPGFAWRVGRSRQESLFIHSYSDRQSAEAAAQHFVATATSRSQIIDWAGKPHLFQCGTALALFLGEGPQALTILTSQCGPPVWKG